MGGIVSVALSLGSRRVGVTNHRALSSSDFPSVQRSCQLSAVSRRCTGDRLRPLDPIQDPPKGRNMNSEWRIQNSELWDRASCRLFRYSLFAIRHSLVFYAQGAGGANLTASLASGTVGRRPMVEPAASAAEQMAFQEAHQAWAPAGEGRSVRHRNSPPHHRGAGVPAGASDG